MNVPLLFLFVVSAEVCIAITFGISFSLSINNIGEPEEPFSVSKVC